jgi:two-component system sensor histidine kinase/response regulator
VKSLVHAGIILFIVSPSLAQQSPRYADSVLQILATAPEDTSKVMLLNDLVLSLRDRDPNAALDYASDAKTLAEKLDFQKGLGSILQNIGWIYYRKGDFAEALENSLKALEINRQFNDSTVVANCLNNIGAIQYERKQYASAISYFKRGYILSHELKDNAIMSRSLNNISFSYLALKQLDSAEYFVRLAIEEGDKAKDRYKTGFSDRILGDIYFEKGQYPLALETYLECLNAARQRGQNSLIASTLHRVGRAYLELKQPDQALTYLLENAEKARKLGYKDELEKTYALLIEAYVQKNDVRHAFESQSRFIAIHDSLFNENNSKQIAQMQSRYEDEIKEARIELLTKDKELQDEEIWLQRITIYSSLAGATLLAVLVFILSNANRKVTKANKELAERNEEVRTQTEQLSQLNSTKDKLLSIIGHDLRSPINGLRGLMELASVGALTREEFQEYSVKVKQNLDYLSGDLDNLLIWARSQLGSMSTSQQPILLTEAVADKVRLFDAIAASKNITLKAEVGEGLHVYADPNHLSIILRNLISNAIKFSNAGGTIVIKGIAKENKVLLSVIDCGVGMTGEDVSLIAEGKNFTKQGTGQEKGIGLGLILVKEFVVKNHGKLSVESALKKGTTFTIELPRHT